jgi:hypothetical protein
VDAADAAVFAGIDEAEVEALIHTLDRLREQLAAAQHRRG